jgi:hypothetical protein
MNAATIRPRSADSRNQLGEADFPHRLLNGN